MLKLLDLFSGIGGFSLGLERTKNIKTISFCEIEPFCQKVLNKHWPDVPALNDIKEICRWTWKNSKAQTLLRQAFLVRTYHTMENVPDFKASALDYGGKCVEPFAWYDHESRCWRTWQRCFIEEWEQFLGVWPRSGMTRNGIAYALPTLDYPIEGIESGLLPTPRRSGQSRAWKAYIRREPQGNLEEILGNLGYQGAINPEFVENMMSFPTGWTEI